MTPSTLRILQTVSVTVSEPATGGQRPHGPTIQPNGNDWERHKKKKKLELVILLRHLALF